MISIPVEKLVYIVVKAREFGAKVEPVEPEPGSNPADSGEREVLEDYSDDATYQELLDALAAFDEDAIDELQALIWIGRGDYAKEDWREAVSAARHVTNPGTAEYLARMPLLPDYIEAGLEALGYSIEDLEAEHL
jgi:hypothetical protein